MVIWHRIGRLWKQLQTVGAQSAARNSRWLSGPHHHHHHRNPSFVYATTRCFAVPIQFRPKAEEDTGTRINGAITASHVRLVSDEGHCIVTRREALDHASKLELDLVEVQRNADPPVCKIMDFHKEKFKRETQEKERAKSKSPIALRGGDCKDVRINLNTEPKDLKLKADMVTRLIDHGYRVKCTATVYDITKAKAAKLKRLTKNQPKDGEKYDLEGLLKRFLTLLEDVAIVESGPHVVSKIEVEKKQAYAIVRHVKFGIKKSGKKATKSSEALGKTRSAVISEEMEPIGCSSQTESNLFEEQDVHLNNEYSRSSQSGLVATADSKPLHQKFSASKSVPDSLRSTPELIRDQRSINPFVASVSSQTQPPIVQINRYAKQTEPGGAHQRKPMERMPRNESHVHGQFVPKQRQFNPSTSSAPGSPTLGHEVVRASKSGSSVVLNGPNSQSKNYGIFSGMKVATSGDQKSGNSTPAPKFGVFIASKSDTSGEQKKSGETVVDKDRDSSSTIRSYGIFSFTTPIGPNDQESPKDASVNNPSNISSAARSYGIFTSSKSAATGS